MSETSRKRTIARRVAFAAVPVTAAALLIPSAMAGAATSPTNYTGCLKKSTGVLSLVKAGNSPLKACPSGTTKATWAIKGPKGATGAQGPKGDKGDSGLQGIQGIVGATGATGATGPAGPAGPAGQDGIAGLHTVSGALGDPGISQVGNTVTVACGAGEVAIGGGVTALGLVGGVLGTLNSLLGSFPVVGATPGWSIVTALPVTNLTGETFHAICATASSVG